MRNSLYQAIFAFTITLCGLFITGNSVIGQEDKKFPEAYADRHSLGINVTRAIPFRSSRSDDSFMHYIKFNSKGNFHKHALLLNVKSNDWVTSTNGSVLSSRDSRSFITGYNLAFGKYKAVHESVNLLFGPQLGYKLIDTRTEITYAENILAENEINTSEKHQFSAGMMGGLEISLSPKFSLYTEASLLVRHQLHNSHPQDAASTTSHSTRTSFNISKNLILLYNF